MDITKSRQLTPNYGKIGFDFLSEDSRAIDWFNHFIIRNPNKQSMYDETLLQEITITYLISEIRKFIAHTGDPVGIIITMQNNHGTYTRTLTRHDIIGIQHLDCIAVLYTDKMIKDYINDVIYRIGNEYYFNPKLDRIDNDISVYLDTIHRISVSSIYDIGYVSEIIYP